MPKKPAPDALNLAKLGKLENYTDDEIAELRERLIDDVARIERESVQLQERISELNRRRSDLQHERAERAKALRAAKHELHQRNRGDVRLVPVKPQKAADERRPRARIVEVAAARRR